MIDKISKHSPKLLVEDNFCKNKIPKVKPCNIRHLLSFEKSSFQIKAINIPNLPVLIHVYLYVYNAEVVVQWYVEIDKDLVEIGGLF